MMVQGHEVVEGIDAIELAGVDQAHEEVADLGSVERFVTQGVSPVEDRRFQSPFADIIVRVLGISEAGQGLPMVEHVAMALPSPELGSTSFWSICPVIH